MNRVSLIAAIISMGLLARIVRADIAPNPLVTGGGTLTVKEGDPTAGDAISMAWEEVDITPAPGKNAVEAVFGLKNTSDKTITFEVGFPSYFRMPLEDFVVKIDGEARPAEFKKESQKDVRGRETFTYWLCWPMTFAPGQEIKVSVAYWCKTSRAFDKLATEGLPKELKDQLLEHESGYVLRTGAGWAGNIGKATIRLHYGDVVKKGMLTFGCSGDGPGNRQKWTYDRATNTDTLVLTDFEPTGASDISYSFRLADAQAEVKLLSEALGQYKLDPWAMKHLLGLIEKNRVLKLEKAVLDARILASLELMVPPKHPRFDVRGPNDGEKTNSDEKWLSRGAEMFIGDVFKRLLNLYDAAGEKDKSAALMREYQQFLQPIYEREKAYFEKNPDQRRGFSWSEFRLLEKEWNRIQK